MLRITACLALPFLVLASACGGAARPARPPAHPEWPVLLAESVGGLGLFRDDAERSAVMLAGWADEHGIRVADPSHTRQVLTRAYRGEHPKTGARCAMPLAAWRARTRFADELGVKGRLTADVDCADKGCNLHVSAVDGLDFDAVDLAAWEAPFDMHAPWPDALRMALAALQPRADEGATGGLGIGGVGDGRVEAKPEHLGFGVWPARDVDQESHDALEKAVALDVAALRPCIVPRGGVEVLLQADASGRVDRCEGREGADEASACVCAVFTRQARVAEVARAKPLFVSTSYQAADVVTPARAVVTASVRTYLDEYASRSGEARLRPRVSDRAIEDWKEPAAQTVAACFRDAAVGTLRVNVRTTFDGAGNAVHATAKGQVSPEQIACVERAFLTARAPCPATPSPTADAVVDVYVKAITP